MGKNAQRRNAAREAHRPRGEPGEDKPGRRSQRRFQDRVFGRIMRRVKGTSPPPTEEKITTVAPKPKRRPTSRNDAETAAKLGFAPRPSGLVVPATRDKGS